MSFFKSWERNFDEEFINYIESRFKQGEARLVLADLRWEEFYRDSSLSKIFQKINGEKVFFEYKYDIRRLQYVEERIIQEYGSIEEAVKQEKKRSRRLCKEIGLAEMIKIKRNGENNEIN